MKTPEELCAEPSVAGKRARDLCGWGQARLEMQRMERGQGDMAGTKEVFSIWGERDGRVAEEPYHSCLL